jgi:hypothetical protein
VFVTKPQGQELRKAASPASTAQPSVPYFIRRKGQTKREAAAVDVIVGDDLWLLTK